MPDAATEQVVVKDVVAAVRPAKDEPHSPHGTFDVILSAPVVDRDGETLRPDEWEPLPEHITFDIDHGMSVASTVGSGRPELDEHGNLVVHGTYASTDLGQTTRALVNERHIRATSVAFLRRQDRKTGKPRRELLNGAFVAVPANPAAQVLSSKALNDPHMSNQDCDDDYDDRDRSPDRDRDRDRDRDQDRDRDRDRDQDRDEDRNRDRRPDQDRDRERDRDRDRERDRDVLAALREQLSDIDPASLPEPVHAVLAALGLIDPTPEPRGDPAGRRDDMTATTRPTALAVRARQLRALSALQEIER